MRKDITDESTLTDSPSAAAPETTERAERLGGDSKDTPYSDVPMLDGDPREPSGPEDAMGGTTRGNYTENVGIEKHREYTRDDDGKVIAVNQDELVEKIGNPDPTLKGGVDRPRE